MSKGRGDTDREARLILPKYTRQTGQREARGLLGHETLLSLYGHQGTEGQQCSGWGSRGAWRAGGQAGSARGISGERNKYIPEDSRARKRRVLRGRGEMPGVGVGQRGSLG